MQKNCGRINVLPAVFYVTGKINEPKLRKSKMKKELELYLHIPFCIRKCEYCDFLSGPVDEKSRRVYLDAMLRELAAVGPQVKEYEVISVYIGGGTPSLLPGDWMEELMEVVRDTYCLKKDAEISMEANPGTLTAINLAGYHRAGINRLSLGCQSTDDTELKLLGRIHTWAQFQESFQMAREAGFANLNVDLMSGLPGQNLTSWEKSLEVIAGMEPEHISAYSLIIEEGTPFAEKKPELPDEEEERQMYERTWEILQSYGYHQYEISNYAKKGKECRHNLGYWTRKEYLGFGVGSASLFQNQRFTNLRDMRVYGAFNGNPESIRRDRETLTVGDQMGETMILGLRLLCGVSRNEFRKNFGRSVEEVYGPVLEKYSRMGLLKIEGDRIALTRAGISVSNPIMADFLLDE